MLKEEINSLNIGAQESINSKNENQEEELAFIDENPAMPELPVDNAYWDFIINNAPSV